MSDDEDADPIPDFLLPDWSAKAKKSPLLTRGSSPPKITKMSLKTFSGLEGGKPTTLASQDSLDSGHFKTRQDSAKAGEVRRLQSTEDKTTAGGEIGKRSRDTGGPSVTISSQVEN